MYMQIHTRISMPPFHTHTCITDPSTHARTHTHTTHTHASTHAHIHTHTHTHNNTNKGGSVDGAGGSRAPPHFTDLN